MINKGVDVFRLNFSHSTHNEHLKLIDIIKDLNLALGTNVSILADLQGPKLRVGEIENDLLNLVEGDIITFVTEKCLGLLINNIFQRKNLPHFLLTPFAQLLHYCLTRLKQKP